MHVWDIVRGWLQLEEDEMEQWGVPGEIFSSSVNRRG